ncbi:hypothetical protein CL621_04755 [archaeon]|nr:hypothetical protein [archaeon]
MIIDIILIITGLIGLAIASITDIKTREVPDWLSYSLIIIGLTLRLFYSLAYQEWLFLIQGLIGFASFFIIANLMYYTKQWGGGDSKLLMGLGALFATYPSSLIKYFQPDLRFPFLIILWVNILIIGAFYGLVYAIILAIKNRKSLLIKLKKLIEKKESKRLIVISLIIAFLFFVSTFLIKNEIINILIFALGIFAIIFPFFWLFTKSIEDVCMYHSKKPTDLVEGDWIANKDLRDKFKISNLGIEKKQINLLIKSKIKKVLVKEGIPFVPSILIALIISLIFGNIIRFII